MIEKTMSKALFHYVPETGKISITAQVYFFPTLDPALALIAYDRQRRRYTWKYSPDWSDKSKFALYAAEYAAINMFDRDRFKYVCQRLNSAAVPCRENLVIEFTQHLTREEYESKAAAWNLPPLDTFKPLAEELKEAGL